MIELASLRPTAMSPSIAASENRHILALMMPPFETTGTGVIPRSPHPDPVGRSPHSADLDEHRSTPPTSRQGRTRPIPTEPPTAPGTSRYRTGPAALMWAKSRVIGLATGLGR